MLPILLHLMPLLLISCDGYKISGISSERNDIQGQDSTISNTTDQDGTYRVYGDVNDYREYENSNVSLDTFFTFIVNISTEQLKNVHKNIKRDYPLNNTEVLLIDSVFKNCDWEYWLTINRYFKKMVSNTSETRLSLSDFTDFSHFLIQEIIENNLKLVQNELTLPTIWSKESFRQTILRQQMKIVMNTIDSQICWNLSLCIKHYAYTDYFVEWLRYVLSASSDKLNTLYNAILPSLIKFMYVIRTNVKFRHKIKYIVQTDYYARKDFLDFVDEVFSNENEIINIMPTELRKSALLFIDLFQLVDDNYSLNDENEIRLKSVSKMLFNWANDEDVEIEKIIEILVHNFELNIKIWPLPEQKRLDYIWSQILSL